MAGQPSLDNQMDTQLLTNYIASEPIPGIVDFVPLYDENHFPMMLYLDGASQILRLVSRNPLTGQVSDKIHLAGGGFLANTSLGSDEPRWDHLPGRVWAFTATQDPITSQLYVLIAGAAPLDPSRGFVSTVVSYISLIGPCSPTELKNVASSAPPVHDWLFPLPTPSNVTGVHLGKPDSSRPLPCVSFTLRMTRQDIMFMLDEQTGQFLRLDISSNGLPPLNIDLIKTSRILPIVQDLTDNPALDSIGVQVSPMKSSMLDMRCGTVNGKHGMWVLTHHEARYDYTYEYDFIDADGDVTPTQESGVGISYFLDLVFYARESDGSVSTMRVELPYECNVNSLSYSVTDKARFTTLYGIARGTTDILLVCDVGLISYQATNSFTPNFFSRDESLKTSTSVYVSQTGDDVRLWSASQNDHAYLGYARFSYDALSTATNPVDQGLGVKLTPFTDNHGTAVTYRALCTSKNAAYDQHFLRLNTDGVVEVVSQSQATGLWTKSQSFFTAPNVSKITEIKSYTSHLVFESDLKNTNRTVGISIKDSAATVWVNGTKYTIEPSSPLVVELPSVSPLNIIQESTDLSAREFTVTDVRSGKTYHANPADKVTQKLQDLDSVDKLKAAGAPDGVDLDETAKRIQNLLNQRTHLQSAMLSSF
ncbi:MAG: hypothetical protein M1821_002472 [Bathelium mastoideum]|nr:MAG: hypothetical protein M1821_002472 [Bathelium mastoideum]